MFVKRLWTVEARANWSEAWQLGFGANFDGKSCTDILFTFNIYLSPHFLNNQLTNTQSEASARLIHLLMLIEPLKINEQILLVLFRNANALVFNFNCKLDATLYALCIIINTQTWVNIFFRLVCLVFSFLNIKQDKSDCDCLKVRSEFDSIWQKVEQYLHVTHFVSINLFEKLTSLLLRKL